MRCGYYEAGRCRSCTDLPTPYDEQLAVKQRAAVEALAPWAGALTWLPPVPSSEAGFRNKAKMVVGGTVEAPTLGILDPDGAGVDLRTCPLYSPGMHALLPVLADLVTRAGLTPYDVPRRRGELKHVLVTESPDGEYLVRLVLRSADLVDRVRAQLPWLRDVAPQVVVLTANLLPAHQALLEGPDEVVLTERDTLTMRLDRRTLLLRPRSFFQTNTAVAEALYSQASAWIDERAPSSVLDLYCGVGGFALHAAAPGRRVLGVEVSDEAVEAARAAASRAGLSAGFRVGDATGSVVDEGLVEADLVVVNPPRRGLGPELCARLEAAPAATILYSSCHVGSLARDLADLPSCTPTRARVLDMFPHTRHFEVLVELRRR